MYDRNHLKRIRNEIAQESLKGLCSLVKINQTSVSRSFKHFKVRHGTCNVAFIISIFHKYLCSESAAISKRIHETLHRSGSRGRPQLAGRKRAGWCLIRLSLRRQRGNDRKRCARCFRRVSSFDSPGHQLITCLNMQQRMLIIYSTLIV